MANQISVKQEIDKIRHNQTFLVIGVLLFTLLFIWAAVSIFSSQQQTKITAAQKEMAAPLQPTINTQILDELSDKTYYSESELTGFTIYKLIRRTDGSRAVVPIGTDEEEFLNTEPDVTPASTGGSTSLFEAINDNEATEASPSSQADSSLGNTVDSTEPAETNAGGEPAPASNIESGLEN